MSVLADVLPAARLGSHADRERFAVDGLNPAEVVFPESITELQAALRTASAAGLALIPAGCGAHLGLGMPPEHLDCVISTERLRRVVDHATADMTVTVEAGVTLADLASSLGTAGQWLPVDPPVPSRTTIGGMVAANLSGPLRQSQGAIRDLVLGLRFVRADGTLITSGGRVVKNVAGYDLHRTFVGSLGTLGVIAEATFKVRPRPEVVEAILVACPSLEAASALVTAVRSTPLEPLWGAMASPEILPASALPSAATAGETVIVGIGIGGVARSVALHRERIGSLADTCAGPDRRTVCAETGSQQDGNADPYGALRDFTATTTAEVVCTAVLLPVDLPSYLHAVSRESEARSIRVRFVAEPAVARVHMAFFASARGNGTPEEITALILRLREIAARGGGHLTVRRAPGEAKRRAGVWGDLGPGAFLMARLKRAFDPDDRLASGRLVERRA